MIAPEVVKGFTRSKRYAGPGAMAYDWECNDCDYVLCVVADYEDEEGLLGHNRSALYTHRQEVHGR